MPWGLNLTLEPLSKRMRRVKGSKKSRKARRRLWPGRRFAKTLTFQVVRMRRERIPPLIPRRSREGADESGLLDVDRELDLVAGGEDDAREVAFDEQVPGRGGIEEAGVRDGRAGDRRESRDVPVRVVRHGGR